MAPHRHIDLGIKTEGGGGDDDSRHPLAAPYPGM